MVALISRCGGLPSWACSVGLVRPGSWLAVCLVPWLCLLLCRAGWLRCLALPWSGLVGCCLLLFAVLSPCFCSLWWLGGSFSASPLPPGCPLADLRLGEALPWSTPLGSHALVWLAAVSLVCSGWFAAFLCGGWWVSSRIAWVSSRILCIALVNLFMLLDTSNLSLLMEFDHGIFAAPHPPPFFSPCCLEP